MAIEGFFNTFGFTLPFSFKAKYDLSDFNNMYQIILVRSRIFWIFHT
jgi:hypothetical protein